MFCQMSHWKFVLTEALIHLEASASGTNEKDFVVRYMWRHIFVRQKTCVTVPASSKSWISRWFRILLASIIFWMRPNLDNLSLEPGQQFTFPAKKHSSFSVAVTFKSIFNPRIIFVPCNLTKPILTRKAFYPLQCVLYVACRNASNICSRANANIVSLLQQCKVWWAYPMWPVNVSNMNKWYKYQIMARIMTHTWIVYVALLTDTQLKSTFKSSVLIG